MKVTHTIVTAVIFISLIACKGNTESQGTMKNTTPKKTSDNQYLKLREQALSVTPEQLGLSLNQDEIIAYGVIMDWEMGGAIATTVTFSTGDASMYLSSGGGIIGGGQHQAVSSAAKQLVKKADSYTQGPVAIKMPLPAENNVSFYILTNKGIFASNETISNFEKGRSPLLPLFEEVNNVIGELRMINN